MVPALKRTDEQSKASTLCTAYNGHLRSFAEFTRHELLKNMLSSLLSTVRDQKTVITRWAESASADRTANDLEAQGKASQAWLGLLEDPHPHQRHIFDLHSLRTGATGANLAVEQLYRWVTGGQDAMNDTGNPLDYSPFVEASMAYMSQQSTSLSGPAAINDPLDVGPNRLAARVVDYLSSFLPLSSLTSVRYCWPTRNQAVIE